MNYEVINPTSSLHMTLTHHLYVRLVFSNIYVLILNLNKGHPNFVIAMNFDCLDSFATKITPKYVQVLLFHP